MFARGWVGGEGRCVVEERVCLVPGGVEAIFAYSDQSGDTWIRVCDQSICLVSCVPLKVKVLQPCQASFRPIVGPRIDRSVPARLTTSESLAYFRAYLVTLFLLAVLVIYLV